MKQVLAVRVGAKKAVGHIVSKRWWPTVSIWTWRLLLSRQRHYGIIELISVRNLRHRPEALFALFRQFLQRLTLPRLCHFLDLVLPQLTPVRAPWADATRTLWTCHYIRATSHDSGYPCQPKVTIARLRLRASSRPMTKSIMCGCFGVPWRSSCFLIHTWCIR